jgi:hypothetical protein
MNAFVAGHMQDDADGASIAVSLLGPHSTGSNTCSMKRIEHWNGFSKGRCVPEEGREGIRTWR